MRYIIVRIVFYLGFVVLGLGLFRTQVIDGAYYRKLGEQNRIRLIPLEAPRGRVFDSKGKLLATNRPSYDVIALPEDVTRETFPVLAKLLNLSEEDLHKKMKAPRESPFAPAVIQEDIPKDLAFVVEEHRNELPGISVRMSSVRYYPYHETAAHLIGYIAKINAEEYKTLDKDRFGYNSFIGRAGLEKVFDDRLRGWRGGKQIEVNARGQMIRVLSEREPEPGEDLHLTIDLELQKQIMEVIKDKHAVVGIMDLKTEGMLVLASTPSYDPNVFVSPSQSEARGKYLLDKDSPMINRGVSSAYPPGSVFKLVTSLTGLETGKINANTRFNCTGVFRLHGKGRPYGCWYKSGHGSLNLYEALERSCNVYFYNVGSRISPEDIGHYARELGLGAPLGLEVTGINQGLVPDQAWKRQKLHDKWYQGETLSFAIGQSYLLTSPMQILRMVSIVAKNGDYVEPTLLNAGERERAHHGRVSIREENFKVIKKGMLQVVQSDYGTGQLARVDFAKLAAKTGTAQVPPKVAHGWMTGFFPYEDPQISFVVFVEHGGSGGIGAGTVVKAMLNLWKNQYGLPAQSAKPVG